MNEPLCGLPALVAAADIEELVPSAREADTRRTGRRAIDFLREARINAKANMVARAFVDFVSGAVAQRFKRALGAVPFEIKQNLANKIDVAFHSASVLHARNS